MLKNGNVSTFRRQSLHQELADALREMIINGELKPGTKLPELELCETFGVSRTPLREALKVLSADHLVVLEPNRGAWVKKITIADLEDVFPVMGALEALAGELACAKITDAEIVAIRALHDEMVGHFEARNLTGYFEINQKIHEGILAAARNDVLSAQYSALANHVRRARYVANMTDARWQQATQEHEQIIQFLEARDAKRLSTILRAHLGAKLETVRAWLLEH